MAAKAAVPPKAPPTAAIAAALMGVVAVTPTGRTTQYDFKTPLVMQGSVNEIRVANPHMRLVLHVPDNKGLRDPELEGHSLNNIYRRGSRVGLVRPGDAITVTIASRKDGAEGGDVLPIRTADGHEF